MEIVNSIRSSKQGEEGKEEVTSKVVEFDNI